MTVKKRLLLLYSAGLLILIALSARLFAAAPTLSATSNSTYTDSSSSGETTGSVSWTSGDVVLVTGETEGNTVTLGVPTTAGSGLSFTQAAATNTANNCKVYAWSATASATSSGTITASALDASNSMRGITVFVYSGSGGIGNNGQNVSQTGTSPSASLVRGSNNSAVTWAGCDFDANADAVATDSPGSGDTQRVAGANVGGHATMWLVSWTDQGASGTTSYGLTGAGGACSPSCTWASMAVEIKGTASGTAGCKNWLLMGRAGCH